MCGFVAIYAEEKLNEPKGLVEKMLSSISHRGPDASGISYSTDGHFLSAFVRLTTNEINSIDQPFSQNNQTLVFNGDIYNTIQILNKAEKELSDVEYLMSVLQKLEIDQLPAFNGEYAFVLYDAVRKRIRIGRDAFGKRPLYYWTNGSKYIFASEMRAILIHPDVQGSCDMRHIYHQLLRCDSTENTFYKDIKIFPIDCFMEVCNKKTKMRRLNTLNLRKSNLSLATYKKEEIAFHVETLVSQAVKRRLSSRFSTGVFLSGGLDSSIIAYEATKASSTPVSSYSIKFEGDEFDESSYALDVACDLSLDHHECFVSDKDLIDYFPEANLRCEHLVQQLDGTGKYLLSKLAGKQHRIIQTGEGADEIFLGYPFFILAKSLEENNSKSTQEQLIRTETARIGGDLVIAGHENWRDICRETGFYSLNRGTFNEMAFLANEVLSVDFKQYAKTISPLNSLLDGLDVSKLKDMNLVQQNQYEFINKTFHSYLMQYLGGKQEMSFGISGRLPFLDLDLVRFVSNIPTDLLLENGIEKSLLRHVYTGKLRPSVINRKKHGFSSNALEAFLKYRPDYFMDALSEKFLSTMGVFCYGSVVQFLKKTKQCKVGSQGRNLRERVIVFLVSLFILEKTLKK
jgi:asparagine synthase (glutamine-hydrolysing)